MLTGEQYLSSLDDGRFTYFEGRQIKDLLAEPAFETPARPSPPATTAASPAPGRPTRWWWRPARPRSCGSGPR
jgi:hypothetical protein